MFRAPDGPMQARGGLRYCRRCRTRSRADSVPSRDVAKAADDATPAPAPAHGPPRHRRGAQGLDTPRAPVRPLLRRGGLPGRRAAPRRPRGQPLPDGHLGLSRGLLRDLVGLGQLHLVRVGLRRRRPPLPPAHLRPDRGRAHPRRRRRQRVQPRRLRHHHRGLSRHAHRPGGAVAAGRLGRPPREAGASCSCSPSGGGTSSTLPRTACACPGGSRSSGATAITWSSAR